MRRYPALTRRQQQEIIDGLRDDVEGASARTYTNLYDRLHDVNIAPATVYQRSGATVYQRTGATVYNQPGATVALSPATVDITDRPAREMGRFSLATSLPAGATTIGKFILTDGTRDLGLDPYNPAIPNIPFEHHMIHEGTYFSSAHDEEINAGTANQLIILFRTPDTSLRAHFKAYVLADNAASVMWYRDATIGAIGATIAIFNNNENAATVASCQAYQMINMALWGTRLPAESILGVNNNKTKFGGDVRVNSEWILRQNTDYVFRAIAANANTRIQWGEEHYEVG